MRGIQRRALVLSDEFVSVIFLGSRLGAFLAGVEMELFPREVPSPVAHTEQGSGA